MVIEEVSEETQKLFNTVYEKSMLENYIEIKILANNKQKQITKIQKENDVNLYLTKVDLVLVINDEALDSLDETQKVIVMEEAFAQIHYDTEKEKIVMIKPDVTTMSGIIRKYGIDEYMRLQECLKALLSEDGQIQKENA
jgi:hypothetical protein